MPIKILVTFDVKEKLPAKTTIKFWITHCLSRFFQHAEVHVDFVDAETMQTLNLQYRQKDYATNVLSFPASVPLPGKQRFLGNIILCPQVIQREACEQKKIFDHHLAHLLTHGCLHLLGYNHEKRVEAKVMESLEVEILAELGIYHIY